MTTKTPPPGATEPNAPEPQRPSLGDDDESDRTAVDAPRPQLFEEDDKTAVDHPPAVVRR